MPGDAGGAPTPGSPGARPAPAQGNGGSATAESVAPASLGGISYVPPDANEVPPADQALLGRYF